MCGIAAEFGAGRRGSVPAMVRAQAHRGPDATGVWESPGGLATLGHNRLSILDLSDAGRQPMSDPSGRYRIIFNGEVYNYLELRRELEADYAFRSRTDTEVLLAAFIKWGPACLDRLIGMFAFVIWDERERQAFGARDRFGVKPLYWHVARDGVLRVASEIGALHAAGVKREEDAAAWAAYLATGMQDYGERTFWNGIRRIAAGGWFRWSPVGGMKTGKWYDLVARVREQGSDTRDAGEVESELESLLEETIRLRFRSDVPVGVCLSGGLDSSLLLGLVRRMHGTAAGLKSFTFHCGAPEYDEVPWVERMLEGTGVEGCLCRLDAAEIPALAARVQRMQLEPFGGFPTLGMAKVHERARREGVVVLLDGNGLDEGWAGYEYYARAGEIDASVAPVQGSRSRSVRPDCLAPEFAAGAAPAPDVEPCLDPVSALQARDVVSAKIPRAMRYADGVSMMHSRELREPFLDHRIMELGLRQPADRKIANGHGKHMVRRLAGRLIPEGVSSAPKRPVQTPQREWLRGELREWAMEHCETALRVRPDWFRTGNARAATAEFMGGQGDNSFFVWQQISLAMVLG